ncbi:MAG: class I SAM-dependent methyltransferase [Desulfobulbaceae bacterium]|nr:class I SAM-dependent methyltransferase [Desulfobulbaceae bacterium]
MNAVLNTVEERWNTYSEKYDATHHGHLSEDDLTLWNRFLETHIGEDRQQKILDVGCGTGFLTIKINALGYKCRGLDLSTGMMDLAKSKAAEQDLEIEFSKGNVAELPFDDAGFDVVTNRSVLWTLLEPAKTFKEWRRVLKPGGKLLCFISIGKGDSKCNHYSQDIEDMLELKGAPASILCRHLEDAGFDEVQAVMLEGIRNRHGNSPWYVIKGRKN